MFDHRQEGKDRLMYRTTYLVVAWFKAGAPAAFKTWWVHVFVVGVICYMLHTY